MAGLPKITVKNIATLTEGYGDRIAHHPDGSRWATAQFGQFHLWEGLTLKRSLTLPYTPPGRFFFNEEGSAAYLGPLRIELRSEEVEDLLSDSPDFELRLPGEPSSGQYELGGAAWSSDGQEGVLFLSYRPAMGIGSVDDDSLPQSRLLRLRRRNPEVQVLLEGSDFDSYRAIAINEQTIAAAHLSIELWSRADGKKVSRLTHHKTGVRDLQFSPDGAWLASISADGMAALWKTEGWERYAAWTAHERDGRVIAFHPHLPILATGGWDDTMKLWSLTSSPECLESLSFPDHVEGISFSPTGEQLVVAARFRKAALFVHALLQG